MGESFFFLFFLEWVSLHFYKCAWEASASAHRDPLAGERAHWNTGGHQEVTYSSRAGLGISVSPPLQSAPRLELDCPP